MSTLQLRIMRQRARQKQRRLRAERRGSTLLIVLVLMTMLASLGVIFYVFAAQERASANYYSDGAKVKQFDIDRDTLFDFGIRQLIEGPRPGTFRNSALSGRRHALLPNMLGLDTTGGKFDFAPFNGTPFPSSDTHFTDINDSAAANNGNDPNYAQLANRDPDYTYPDNNNVFLSYDGYDPIHGQRIIIPSFHRPQTLARGSGWHASAAANDVLRPHTGHIWVPPAGQRPPSPAVSRYLTAGDIAGLGASWTGWGVFPTTPHDFDLDGTSGEQGVWSLTTPYTAGTTVPNYEYDVDNNGDGIREGVWLDVDFPALENSAGLLYVPFFSFTVVDADGLLNLNAHGNMARVWNRDVRLDASPFIYVRPPNDRSDPFISKSNQGLFPSEVNPLWALNRRPPVAGGSAADYDGSYSADPFFSAYGPVPENWVEAANRDWLYLLMGRYTQSPADLVPGRWGEEHLLYRAITNSSPLNPLFFSTDGTNVLADPWPGPGQTKIDDNGDTNKVTGDWFGSTYQAFGKPLDYTGLGSYWVSATPKIGNYGNPGVGTVPRWPMFNAYSSAAANPVQWPNTGLSGTLSNGLYNDAGEMVLDGDFKKDEDGLFGAEEMRALFLNSADFAYTTGGESRITQLAPYNFETTLQNIGSGANARSAQEFRSKFTTRSWDRKQHAIGYNSARAWEFNFDSDGDTSANLPKEEFPPQFGGVPYSTTDLFRPVLRQLIEVERNNFDQPRYQLRLNLNQLLVGPNGNPQPSFPSNQRPPNIQLHYRPLTPHPDQSALAATPIIAAASYPQNGNFGTATNDQEFWARKDRQLMARDFFALLYTLTWPNGIDPTSNATLTSATLRQLAQYAVNLVDSIDRDNVITRFEYDTNPRDGWNLDDDPFTTGDTDRGEVYGVERLDLTLSEALAVRTDTATSDLPFTQWDDMENRHFAYIELRNPGPEVATLSNRAWRIEFGDDYTKGPNPPGGVTTVTPDKMRRLELRDSTAVQPGELYTIGSVDGSSVPGTYHSIMKVDPTGSTPTDWDSPRTPWIAPAQEVLRLDLRDTGASSRFQLTDASGTAISAPLALYDDDVYDQLGGDNTNAKLYVRLYRRLSPNRPFPSTGMEELDNPYVLVDEIALNDIGTDTETARGGRLRFVAGDTMIATKLGNLRSRRHAEPFSTNSDTGYAYTTSSGAYGNTLANDDSANALSNWQKVFDRDFASLGELLQVTLGGFSNMESLRGTAAVQAEPTENPLATINPDGRSALPTIASSINNSGTSWYLQTSVEATPAETRDASAEQFFRPIHTSGATAPPQWYRFLEIVEVASKVQATIPGFPDPVDYPRVAGKLNINMLRHPEVLAALMDDPTIMRLFVDEDANLNGTLDSGEDVNGDMAISVLTPPLLTRADQTLPSHTPAYQPRNDATSRSVGGSTIRSWWDGLTASRDGTLGGTNTSPYQSTARSRDTTGLFLPGLPESRPFRSFGAGLPTGSTDYYLATEQTLLRSWPGDDINRSNQTNDPRGFFELGTSDERIGEDATPAPPVDNGPYQVPTLDPYVRSRILNKVMNNVTTRSNVFVVFMSVKFFRANRDATTGAVQVGGPLMDPSLGAARWEPEYRRFFVIDRSQIEKAFDPQADAFNFRALIEFQQDLQ